jgi:hypothetical protein
MRFCCGIGIIMAVACLQGVVAQTSEDTVWLARDTAKTEVMFYQLCLADTFPDNRGGFTMVDTGAALDGYYINFNYQFTNAQPGYSGYKVFWDTGRASFYVTDFDSMILWHKGPLQGHKVKMIWAQGSAGCGTPINYEYFGEFKSSDTWKRESFPFPEKRGNSPQNPNPDDPFVKGGLFELRILIYNDGATSQTSPPGDLKIDNLFFLRNPAQGVLNPKLVAGAAGGPRFFVPTVSGKVTLAIFSLQGEQLFKENIDVTAGKKYDVGQFARNNSKLSTSWIHCVQITGSGVNITRKMFH